MTSYYNDRSWKMDKEALLKSLEAFFKEIPFEDPPSCPFHKVYAVNNYTAAFMAMEKLYNTFYQVGESSSFGTSLITCFYIGDYKHRYKFIDSSTVRESTCFIIEETLIDDSIASYRRKVTRCSNRVFLSALLITENEDKTAFNIKQTELILPGEKVQYRLHKMHIEPVTGSDVAPKNNDEMVLLYFDSHTGEDIVKKYRGAIQTYMSSSYFIEKDVTENYDPYSEWGFWNQINGLKDEYDQKMMKKLMKLKELLRNKRPILCNQLPQMVRVDFVGQPDK